MGFVPRSFNHTRKGKFDSWFSAALWTMKSGEQKGRQGLFELQTLFGQKLSLTWN
jgi:hypothetical protein